MAMGHLMLEFGRGHRAKPDGEDGLEANTTTNHTVRFVKSNQHEQE